MAKKLNLDTYLQNEDIDEAIRETSNKFDSEKRPELEATIVSSPERKAFKFEKIFDESLRIDNTNKKVPTTLYNLINKKVELLLTVLPNQTKADTINYILNDFFKKNSSEIKKALVENQKNINEII